MPPITYKSLALFASGPHLPLIRPMGELLLPLLNQGQSASGFSGIGALALTIEVRGRLLPAAKATITDQLLDIEAQLLDPPVGGDLELPDGRIFPEMCFTRFERTAPLDIGRTESQAYVATFTRLPR
ncbi:MAG: hypothetical protein ACREJO_04915 [Phycisphaerales bacterium]